MFDIVLRKRISSHTASLERVEVLSNKQVIQNTTNSDTLERTREGVNQICDSVKDFGRMSQASSKSTCQALEEMSQKIHDLSGLSIEQSTTLDAILELLKQQSAIRSQQSAAEAVPHEAIDVSDNVETKNQAHEASDDDDLQDALYRLCHLAKEQGKTLFSAEAESIIRDVEQMLAFLLKAEEGDKSVKTRSKRRRASYENDSYDDQDLQYRHEVKRIKGLLTASHCVGVNERGVYKMLYDLDVFS